MKYILMSIVTFLVVFVNASGVSHAGPGAAWVWQPNNWYTPNRACASVNCPVNNWIKPNTKVWVQCWMDNQYMVGNYGSVRWFKVFAPISGGQWGFIHSSYIYYQPTTIPRC